MSATNYARHITTKEIIFAADAAPASWWRGLGTLNLWAFHKLPHNIMPHEFEGRLIGEDPQSRCARQNHAPMLDACETCRNARLGKNPMTPTERYRRKTRGA
jgi:hypothetical protein